MDTQVLDQPSVQASQAPTEAPRDDATSTVVAPLPATLDADRSHGVQGARREAPHAARWQMGAHLAIGMVSLLVLLMLAIVAIFSVPSAQLFTVDAAIGLAIIVLGLALSGLLVLAHS